MDSTGSIENSKQQPEPSGADYHHGAEMLKNLCETSLAKQLVEIKSAGKQVIICVGNTEIVLLIDSNMTDANGIKFVNSDGKIVGQIINVRMGS